MQISLLSNVHWTIDGILQSHTYHDGTSESVGKLRSLYLLYSVQDGCTSVKMLLKILDWIALKNEFSLKIFIYNLFDVSGSQDHGIHLSLIKAQGKIYASL